MYEQMKLFPFDAKGRRGRLVNWTSCTAEELWLRWREQFESDDEAIATAVWMCNRLIKSAARSSRASFYSIKDAFIRRYGGPGKRVREEVKTCWGCGGEKVDEWGDECARCDGTGVYSSRWLYLYEFEVAGRRYSLHSYVEPELVLEEMGENAEHFGGQFESGELKSLALPMSGLLRLLRYVAAAIWKMNSHDGIYY